MNNFTNIKPNFHILFRTAFKITPVYLTFVYIQDGKKEIGRE